ncbi:hypothetical protein J5Y03_05255 [Bacillus sp. RG28]|uniref:Uncharacterized protein n=1 Tax=Gottfriedia endophytica TaxID=2820819 RepID=A0A940SJU4_9BACI|nr:hypothetical protein [Gottfriedia endophytica]MBP0724593.1 hypothetical protein [Gottfriedia endophytica]
MVGYFIDLVLVAIFVIGITAFNGVITNSIGEKLFGRKEKSKFVDMSDRMTANFNRVGGKGIYRKKTY